MKPMNSALALLTITSAIALAQLPKARAQEDGFQKPYPQYPATGDINISDGNLRIYAMGRDESGLLRDVTLELAGSNSILMSAKYARRTASAQWILGDAVIHTFDANGNSQSEARAHQYTVNVDKRSLALPAQKVITEGGLQLSAASQDANGLLHDVLIKTASSQSKSDPTRTRFGGATFPRIFAKYARRDPKQAGHWILGDGVTYNFNLDGTLKSETRYQRLLLSTQFGGEREAPVTALKFDATIRNTTQVFRKKSGAASLFPDEGKAAPIAPKQRGFQLL